MANNNTNYDLILKYEEKTARYISGRIIEKPEISFWMFLIPIVFIPFMQRYQQYKAAVESFSLGYLFTKKLALDVAFKIFEENASKEQAMDLAIQNVKKDSKAKSHINKIYERQLNEISLLADHYLRLLNSTGTDYFSLVKNSYINKDEYLAFLENLFEAEKSVNQAAIHAVKLEKNDTSQIIKRMEQTLVETKKDELKYISF